MRVTQIKTNAKILAMMIKTTRCRANKKLRIILKVIIKTIRILGLPQSVKTKIHNNSPNKLIMKMKAILMRMKSLIVILAAQAKAKAIEVGLRIVNLFNKRARTNKMMIADLTVKQVRKKM